ncbi:MAG: lysophospholipase [Pseudomonadota bacterium]
MSTALRSESTLSTFTATDGDNLAVQDWPLPEGMRLRGVVVLVHGLGEHAGRYEALARRLNGWGFAVRGYDQFGHGESDGARGGLPVADRLTTDLADVIDSTRLRTGGAVPIIVFGHSMGGVVAASTLAQGKLPVQGLVLSSPALDPGLSGMQKLLLAVVPRVAPNLTLGNGLEIDLISHDPDVVAAYRRDPLVHDRVSARLALFIAQTGATVIAQAPTWRVPTLLLYAGADKLVNPDGSRAFAAAAPASVVTHHCFEELFHEIFNELDNEPVYDMLRRWLDDRF